LVALLQNWLIGANEEGMGEALSRLSRRLALVGRWFADDIVVFARQRGQAPNGVDGLRAMPEHGFHGVSGAGLSLGIILPASLEKGPSSTFSWDCKRGVLLRTVEVHGCYDAHKMRHRAALL